MDGRNVKPPDKGKSIDSSSQDNESTELDAIEIKQEPDVKLETEDVDNIVTVPASERATCGPIVNLIGGEQTGHTYDFTDVCELNEAKSEMKKEKIYKKAEKSSAEFSGNDTFGPPTPKYAKDFRSQKSNKKVKKTVATVRNKPSRSNKKKSILSKKGEQHKCSSCDYTTPYKGNLKRHIRKHTGEKPFPCTHCANRFTEKSNLQVHMRLHVNEFLFSCSNCLKGFSQCDEKVEHEISCTIRRFECHLCKEFPTFNKTHLKYHMRVHHTGEKPFGCDSCSKRFNKQSHLKRHLKTHINPRPLKFKCSVCYRNFSHRIESKRMNMKRIACVVAANVTCARNLLAIY